jgi:hypothetical protein
LIPKPPGFGLIFLMPVFYYVIRRFAGQGIPASVTAVAEDAIQLEL